MKLVLKRIEKTGQYTIGKLYIDGVYFCDTLEDTDRGLVQNMSLTEIALKKIKGETAIPTGIYKITLDVVSPKYSTRDAYTFCGGRLPRLLNVPGYDGILIHIGNYPKDTEGCLLVGKNNVNGAVMESTATFKKLYETLLKDRYNLTIEIA
ncbi:MAG: DUF5675 family protein [Prevotella sp.]|jgi:hypothetical protein|nr:DUF5675 family protein [Prevotella sp.]